MTTCHDEVGDRTSTRSTSRGTDRACVVALVGYPNSGKTTLFNRLTGARQKVGNYAGVTVEQRRGWWHTPYGDFELVDLPGLYALDGYGLEERIAATALLGLRADTPPPDAVIVVVDYTQSERGLLLLAEVLALGIPVVVAFNMADLARQEGVEIDVTGLADHLGVPTVALSAREGTGLEALAAAVARLTARGLPDPRERWHYEEVRRFLAAMAARDDRVWREALARLPSELHESLVPDPEPWRREGARITHTAEVWAEQFVRRVGPAQQRALSQRIDDLLLHPIWGMVIFLATMFLVFQSVYTLAEPLVAWVEAGMTLLAHGLDRLLADSQPMLRDLLVEAGVYGAGNVLVFLPQILLLFLWIALLEETGYLARVTFLIDRPMRAVGLSGRSFIPMLTGFACAVPAVMAARTIEDRRTRLITILVTPLLTCSARLPVYTLLIGAFVPQRRLLGILDLQGLVLFLLYAAGVASALGLARLLKPIVARRGIPVPMILELPIYRWPDWRNVALTLWDRAKIFLRRAGTIIFGASIVLWFMMHYPVDRAAEQRLRAAGADGAAVARYRVEHSLAGWLGHLLEPVVTPLGYDWRIAVSLIASFSAREVMVATLGTIYQVEDGDAESRPLREALRADPTWDLATAISLLVWYVYALQCISTVAIMRRELGGWRWPLRALVGTYGLAWVAAWIAYHVSA